MRIFVKLASVGVLALAAVTPAFSQAILKATVPFRFHVGAKALPAGEYELTQVLTEGVVLQNIATGEAAMTIAAAAPPSGAGATALVFHQYGESYFLSEMSTPDSLRSVGMSKLERQVAAEAKESAENSAGRQDVYIAARAK